MFALSILSRIEVQTKWNELFDSMFSQLNDEKCHTILTAFQTKTANELLQDNIQAIENAFEPMRGILFERHLTRDDDLDALINSLSNPTQDVHLSSKISKNEYRQKEWPQKSEILEFYYARLTQELGALLQPQVISTK